MKNAINTIVALFILIIGSTQTYAMELFKTNQPTHSVSIIENPYTYGNRSTTFNIEPNLNILKNMIGEKGLKVIHDELIAANKYRMHNANNKNDRFAYLDADISYPIKIWFYAQDNNGNSENFMLEFNRANISSSETKSSTLEKLQHCLYGQKTEKQLNKLEPIQHAQKTQSPSDKNNNVSENSSRTTYIITGIGLSLLIFFVAHKLNLLPTELLVPFKNILSKISENVTLPSNIRI